MARSYQFRQEQWLPVDLQTAFAFFSDARNLELLTPPWLQLRILTPPVEMRQGARIQHELRWRLIRLRWTSEITVWSPPHRFEDVQLKGPYKHWRHAHAFVASNGGTRMTDVVEYQLPLGFIGRLLHWLRVRRDIEAIFAFRARRLRELFGDQRDPTVRLANPGSSEGGA
jgi:hypothetical protein